MRREIELANDLVSEYETRDPFRLAMMLDVTVKFIDAKRQKGLCAVFDDIPFIFINQNLSEQMQKMACAHELGHILLHREILSGSVPLLEYELFNIQNSTEYEANVFAANVLIGEEELDELITEDSDVVSVASALDVNVNLLLIRMIEMRKAGHEFRIPFTPDHKFMGRIGDSADSV